MNLKYQDYKYDKFGNVTDNSNSDSDEEAVDDILISIDEAEKIFKKNIKEIQKDAADVYYSNLSRIANKYMNRNSCNNDDDVDDDDDSDVIDFSTLDFSKFEHQKRKSNSNSSTTKTSTISSSNSSSSEEENSFIKNKSIELVKLSARTALNKQELIEKNSSMVENATSSAKKTTENLYKLYLNNLINDDINFQRQCFENLIQLLSSEDKYNYNHILRYLVKQIKQNCGFLPPPNQQVYPICRFDSQSEPKFEFFIKSKQTTNIIEILNNFNSKFLNESKLIYTYVFDYYQQHINEF